MALDRGGSALAANVGDFVTFSNGANYAAPGNYGATNVAAVSSAASAVGAGIRTPGSVSGYISVAQRTNLATQQFAVSLLVQPRSVSTDYAVLWDKGGIISTREMSLFVDASLNFNYEGVGGSQNPIAINSGMSFGNLYEITLTRNAASLCTIYINGIAKGTFTESSTVGQGTLATAFGYNQSSGGTDMAATFVRWATWQNYCPTDDQVASLAAAPFAMLRPVVRRTYYKVAAGGSGALSGSAAIAAVATATLTGTGALSGTASIAVTATGTLKGAGALSGAASITGTATGTLTGTAALSGSASIAATATGTLTGAGALSGTAALAVTASGTLSNGVGLAGTAAIAATASGTLKGAGALSGSGAIAGTATGTLTGTGALTGTAVIAATASGTLTGAGRLIGTAAPAVVASGTLTGGQTLVGTAAIAAAASGTLRGIGALVGGSAIAVTASGNLATPWDFTWPPSGGVTPPIDFAWPPAAPAVLPLDFIWPPE